MIVCYPSTFSLVENYHIISTVKENNIPRYFCEGSSDQCCVIFHVTASLFLSEPGMQKIRKKVGPDRTLEIGLYFENLQNNTEVNKTHLISQNTHTKA